jgi:membrane protease YdiL (CAAX protease family)
VEAAGVTGTSFRFQGGNRTLPIPEPAPLLPIIAGFLFIWLVLDRSALSLGSFRGEAGILVALLTVLAAVVVERALFGRGPAKAVEALGFGTPARNGLLTALLLSAGLLAFFPIYAAMTQTPLRIAEGWWLLAPGLFAQAGIAEEALFRGFLYRHVRRGRGFWRAALIASLPFIAVHLLLFRTLDFPLALAALLVSVSLSFPLAHLFELSRSSIWPGALLHFVVQGAIKLVVAPAESLMPMAMAWMLLATLAPWLVFLVKRLGSGEGIRRTMRNP